MSDLIEELRGIRLLEELSDPLLEQLGALARIVEFPAGAVIFRQGGVPGDIYIVISGNVALEICAPGVGCKRILTVAAGELLGWSPVLEQGQLTATARAISQTRAVALNGLQLLALFEREPRIGYEFMKRTALALAQRLSAARLQMLDVYGSQMAAVPDERAAAMSVTNQP